jgi:poly-gamma-glutamate synthesis protein (capsule biosynthesis protein)
VHAPDAVAPGGRLRVRVSGLMLPARTEVLDHGAWRAVGRPLRRPRRARVLVMPDVSLVVRLRARGADGRVTAPVRVRVRPLRLAAVGDVNLGDGPGGMIDRFGSDYPWRSVAARTAAADIAFANLECAVSTRGSPQAKQFVFRGSPRALGPMSRLAGFDVVNLANNHAGDYGDAALLDTLRHVRDAGMRPVGAGATEAEAYRPRYMRRLGLRVAFAGFSTILPFEFRALDGDPGTAWGFPERVRATVSRARRHADVVIATFHWGIERDARESPAQRALADVALDAGADAVIGAHPHVLQPIRRLAGERLVAYSLGNFVFSAATPGTSATGILQVGLGRLGVIRAHLVRAAIQAGRPVLDGG